MGVLLHSDWSLVGYFVDFTSPYILKSIFTLLNNKQEVHLKSILKCRDLGKSSQSQVQAKKSGHDLDPYC